MPRENFNDLLAFVTVAREGSFTRAAAQLGVSQSALSHTIRGLEARLDLRLLTRTTRSVSPTEAGRQLLARLTPALQDIACALEGINAFRDSPMGTLRINAPRAACQWVLPPLVSGFLQRHPLRRERRHDSYARCGIQDFRAPCNGRPAQHQGSDHDTSKHGNLLGV